MEGGGEWEWAAEYSLIRSGRREPEPRAEKPETVPASS